MTGGNSADGEGVISVTERELLVWRRGSYQCGGEGVISVAERELSV